MPIIVITVEAEAIVTERWTVKLSEAGVEAIKKDKDAAVDFIHGRDSDFEVLYVDDDKVHGETHRKVVEVQF